MLGDDEPFVFNNIDDLEYQFELWKAEDEEREAEEEAEKKRIQEEAVESWKQQQLQQVEARRQKIEEQRSSLRAELTKQRVAPQQIEDIVNHVHPREQVSDELRPLHLTTESENAPSVASSDHATKSAKSRRWSILSKKYFLPASLFSPSING